MKTVDRAIILLCACLAVSPSLRADGSETVEELVELLNDRQLSVRDESERKLTAMGTAALEYLPAPERRMPAELQQRLTRIRNVLERQLSESYTQASQVTLKKDSAPISEVLAELEQKTGNRVEDFRNEFGQPVSDPTISVDFEDEIYWKALDTILDKAGLTLYGYAGGDMLPLVTPTESDVPRQETAVYAGPFRIEPTTMEARRDFRKSSGGNLRLHLQLWWEPRMVPVAFHVPLNSIVALDDRGETLTPESEQPELELPVHPGTSSVDVELSFPLPTRDARSITSVKGKATATVLGRQHKFVFENLRPGLKTEQRQGAANVVIDQIRKFDEGIWQVFLRVQYDQASGALESHRSWVLRNPATLMSDSGEAITSEDFELTGQTPNEMGIMYFFVVEKDIGDYRLIYETPSSVVRVPVEFELKDLKLP